MSLKGALTHHRKCGVVRSPRGAVFINDITEPSCKINIINLSQKYIFEVAYLMIYKNLLHPY